MRKLVTLLLCAVSTAATAQRIPVPCGTLPESSYAKCLKESRDRAERALCVSMLEFDVREIDEWQQCRMVEIEAEAVKQKEAAAALASQARTLLMMRVRTNVSR